MTFVPLMVPLLFAVPFGPLLAWKRADIAAAFERLIVAGLLAIVVFVAALAMTERGPWLAPFGFAIGVWIMAGCVVGDGVPHKLGSVPASESWRRLVNLPRSAFGTMLAHFGVGLMVCGIVGTTGYKSEEILLMRPGETKEIAGYALTFRGAAPSRARTTPKLSACSMFRVTARAVTHLEPVEARLRRAAAADQRSGHLCRLDRRPLRGAGRPAAGRRVRRAPLLPPARALHLDRHAHHVPRRRDLALRPAPERWRSASRFARPAGVPAE